jgi:hypothetical protein
MKKCLKFKSNYLYYYKNGEKIYNKNNFMFGNFIGLSGDCSGLSGDCTGLRGDCSELIGNCTGLSGDCSGLRGDCSYLIGNLDECELSETDRGNKIDIRDLIK